MFIISRRVKLFSSRVKLSLYLLMIQERLDLVLNYETVG